MQGQNSTSNSFPESIYLDHGPNANNHGLVHHNVVPVDVLRYDGRRIMGWIAQSGSGVSSQNQVSPEELNVRRGWLSFSGAPAGSGQWMPRRHSETQNQVNPDELNVRRGWLSFSGAQAGSGQWMPRRHSEPNDVPFLENTDIRLSNGPVTNGPSTLQSARSDAIPHNIDLNVEYDGNSNQDMGAGLCLCPYEPDRSETDQIPPANDSSIPLVISSGTAGYVVEENDGGSGLSSDGQRLSCKRKAPEDASGQLSLGGSSSSTQQAENSEQQAVHSQDNASSSLNISTSSDNPLNVSHPEQLNTGLGVGMIGEDSNMHQSSSVAGNPESFQRNSRIRRTPANQLVPANISSSGTPIWNSHVQPPSQSSLFFPFNHSPNTSSAAAVNTTSRVLPLVHVPNSFQTMQPSPWNWDTGSRGNSVSSISPVVTVNGVDALQGGENSMNIPRNLSGHIMRVPETGRENLAQNPTNLSFAHGNACFPGNVASNYQNGFSSGVHLTSAPTWVPQHNPAVPQRNPAVPQRSPAVPQRIPTVRQRSPPVPRRSPAVPQRNPPVPQRNPAEQYAQRVSEIVRRSMTISAGSESGGQGSNHPPHPGASATMREMAFSGRSDNARPSQTDPRSEALMRAARQADPVVGIPHTLRSLAAAAQRRSRLVSEVRNALGLVRRGGTLQFEDVMIIDRSVLYGAPNSRDVHEDMRLDVDNMSYEELLALEEQIGNVSTGLNEEAILAHLSQRKYQSIRIGTPVEDAPCCICQEDYLDGEDLGKLRCGHDFHFDCIKQWLMQKNSCPICKMMALAI